MAKTESNERVDGRIDHATVVDWYEDYLTACSEPIEQSLEDQRFYHGKQWDKEDVAVLKRRGQPVVTFNRIAPKINYIRGTEVRTRIDPRAEPVTPAHKDEAPAITDALRYVADSTDFDRVRSKVTHEILSPGAAGAVLGVDKETGDITLTPVRWSRFWWDPHSIEDDFSDAKYLGIVVWLDLQDAITDPRYAGKKDILEAAASEGGGENYGGNEPFTDKPNVWYDKSRDRIRICEAYYKTAGEWYVCHYTGGGSEFLIEPQPVAPLFVDDKGKSFCPLVATSGFVDEKGFRYGVIRGMKDPQREVNKRRSLALHQSIARQVIYEDDAVDNIDEFQSELMKPAGAMKVRPNALTEKRVIIADQAEMSQSQFSLYQDAKGEIDATGPSAPIVAGDQSVMSGRAIMAKQNIGSMELETIFDNLRNWQTSIFRGMWYLIRNTWTEGKWLRVRDSSKKEGFRFVAVNQDMTRLERLVQLIEDSEVPLESAIGQIGLERFEAAQIMQQAQQFAQQQVQQMMQQAQQMGQKLPPDYMQKQVKQLTEQALMQAPKLREMYRVNDIAKLGVDIKIDSSPDVSVLAQEEYAELMKFTAQGGWNAPPFALKAIIENSNLRSKESILEALNKPPDPQQVQMRQMQIQLQMKQAEAQIALAQAQTASLQAGVQKVVAEAQIAIPAEAQKDQAQAVKYATEAGSNTLPQPPMPGGI